MAGSFEQSHIADQQHLTVIVRVVLNRRGRLVQGAVVDLKGTVHGRFVMWSRLGRAVRTALSDQRRKRGPKVQRARLARPGSPGGADTVPASDHGHQVRDTTRPGVRLSPEG